MNKEITANHGETMLFTGTVIGHTTGQPMNQKLANLTINVLQQYLDELDK